MELNFDEERERLQSVRAELLARVTVLDGALEALAGLPAIAPKRARRHRVSPRIVQRPVGHVSQSAQSRQPAYEGVLG
jgi:hypothetical protein